MFGSMFERPLRPREVPREFKKIALMIIAPQNFRDEECFETKDELEKSGVRVKIASLTKGEKKGTHGGTINAELPIGSINVEDYDAVIFVGGNGAQIYFQNPIVLDIARQAYRAGKVTAAICIAPVILANSGILNGKRATVWEDNDSMRIFRDKNVDYTGKGVEVDGKIVTANGPKASRDFARKIIDLLKK